jgi:hypothetical protein
VDGAESRLTSEVVQLRVMMLDFIKRKRASRALELAVAVRLLGRDDLKALLKQKYEAHWAGVVTDIVKGANSYVTALALIEILIIDALNNDLTKEQAKHVVDAICENAFDDQPAVFDIIAQAAYYSYLMEKDGTATAGTASLFLNDIANWFSDQPEEGGLFQPCSPRFSLWLCAELLGVLPDERYGRFQANADTTPVIDKCAFSGNFASGAAPAGGYRLVARPRGV